MAVIMTQSRKRAIHRWQSERRPMPVGPYLLPRCPGLGSLVDKGAYLERR